MFKLKTAKILFFLAALLFLAKPFLGFSFFSRTNPPSAQNIFVKVFAKRKLEQNEESKFSMSGIQKQLADAAGGFVVRFTFLLAVIFPFIFAAGLSLINRLLKYIQASPSSCGHVYLFNRNLII